MDSNHIIKDYLDGIGTTKLAKKYSVHRSTIQKILKTNNISLRKTSPHTSYNVKFFSTYTNDSCYWAGFILADGYIRDNRNLVSIKLAKCDELHLCKFKDNIQYTGSVHMNKSQTYSYIDICGSWFKHDLINNFDITPRKSHTATYTNNIPYEFHKSFIRGIFDGDGSITYQRSTHGRRPIMLIYGTESVLTTISLIIQKSLNIHIKNSNGLPKLIKKNGCYSMSYSCKHTINILKWLYSNITEHTYLNRKYHMFNELYKEYTGESLI